MSELFFYGGVGSTTGANIMLVFGGKKILIDCGLFQGSKLNEERNLESFKYNPSEVDFLLITHAHMDHIGRVPKLVRDGFKGKIISTKATFELAKPMLEDALRVFATRHPDKTLYESKDIEAALGQWSGYDYKDKVTLFQNCSIVMENAGHILGSAIFKVFCNDGLKEKVFAFTGDLGNSPSPLLPDNDTPQGVDYLVIESVYGDRNHDTKDGRRHKLKNTLLSAIGKSGTVIIPSFSIERTQVLLYEINNMIEDREIPTIPVFLDSPLAEKVTAIYEKYKADFKESVKSEIEAGDDIFDFPKFKIVTRVSESAAIEREPGAKIILSGSGMSEGGRVVNHELHYLSDPKATIILVGYQAVGSLGRKIQDGDREVWINGKKIPVRATVENILGYSSHKDSDHLLEFVEKVNPKKVFVIMGEPKSSLFLVQRIREYLDIEAVYPDEGRGYK